MALSIGVYDGLHRGHQALLADLSSRARENGDLSIGVVTFDVHPRSLTSPDRAPRTLMTLTRRLEVLECLGIDQVGVLPFARIQHLSLDEFVSRVLVGGLNARLVMVGRGFRYGSGRSGTVESLQESGERYGFGVDACELLQAGSDPISSSRIRRCIAQGDMGATADLLGRPHELAGLLGRTERLGPEHGILIAGIDFEPGMALPGPGAYAIRAVIDGNTYPALCLIGTCRGPSDSTREARVHILDRTRAVDRRKKVTLRFVERMRDIGSDSDPVMPAVGLEQELAHVRQMLGFDPGGR